MSQYTINTIEEAIEDIKAGKMIIVIDDEDRENEGDLIMAARHVTPEAINFMATNARGLICIALTEKRCKELELDMMVPENTSQNATPFTVSVDLLGNGCTTGISASDRSKTIQALINLKSTPQQFGRPGHIFPLKAAKGGVIRRAGHTEASVDLARFAGFEPAGVLVEIMKKDGSMARLPDLMKMSKKFNLKIITIKDLITYKLHQESLIQREVEVDMPTASGNFRLIAYRQLTNDLEHLALVKGEWNDDESILVRVHSSCITGDIFGSCRCDCGPQLQTAMEMIEKEGKGVIVYMNQEGRGIGLLNKLRAYQLQEQGMDTYQANEYLGFQADERDYGVGAQILRDLRVNKIKLMSNNPTKRAGLLGYGLEIIENVPIRISASIHNQKYLDAKKNKMGHEL